MRCIVKAKILILILSLILINNRAIADEYSLQEQLNKQNDIIEAQSKRIYELEIFIKEFKNNLSKNEPIKITPKNNPDNTKKVNVR